MWLISLPLFIRLLQEFWGIIFHWNQTKKKETFSLSWYNRNHGKLKLAIMSSFWADMLGQGIVVLILEENQSALKIWTLLSINKTLPSFLQINLSLKYPRKKKCAWILYNWTYYFIQILWILQTKEVNLDRIDYTQTKYCFRLFDRYSNGQMMW